MSMTTVKERPILFSGPMIRALLAGRKTQTRRIIPNPVIGGDNNALLGWRSGSRGGLNSVLRNPYGYAGYRLWVKETHRYPAGLDHLSPKAIAASCLDAGYKLPWAPTRYEADGGTIHRGLLDPGENWGKTRVSIHMPRWSSRILLELADVRVERLQDISEEDAIAEGATDRPVANTKGRTSRGWSMDWSLAGTPSRWGSDGASLCEYDVAMPTARSAFGNYINRLHGGDNWNLKRELPLWDQNPYVWALTFRLWETRYR